VVIGCATITTDTRALWKANNPATYDVLARGGWIDDVPDLPGVPPWPEKAAGISVAAAKAALATWRRPFATALLGRRARSGKPLPAHRTLPRRVAPAQPQIPFWAVVMIVIVLMIVMSRVSGGPRGLSRRRGPVIIPGGGGGGGFGGGGFGGGGGGFGGFGGGGFGGGGAGRSW
jgi:hypothetical protein